MPILRNAIKQVRKDKKRAIANLKLRADMQTLLKKTRKAVASKEKGAEEMVVKLQQSLDKAVKRNILKRNAASRTLSRVFAKKNVK